MTTEGAGPSHLRPVPAGGAASEAVAQADQVDPSGLTPPQKRGGSRFISDVIVEMGFVPRERVNSVFHYVPLHSAPAGRRFGRSSTPELPVTDRTSESLLRLPLWVGMSDKQIEHVIAAVHREVE